MTHLNDLLLRWDHYSKGESETTRQIREAIKKDAQEANARMRQRLTEGMVSAHDIQEGFKP